MVRYSKAGWSITHNDPLWSSICPRAPSGIVRAARSDMAVVGGTFTATVALFMDNLQLARRFETRAFLTKALARNPGVVYSIPLSDQG